MKLFLALVLAASAFAVLAQDQEIQRSVIQRDQQSAEFAARLRGADVSRLEQLHARQLSEIGSVPLQAELRPYQRQKMSHERVLALPPPVTMVKPPERPAYSPLPLPGGPKHGVEPIPVEGNRN